MIIAIPIEQMSLKSKLSTKFARSSNFAVVNKLDKNYILIKNPYADENVGVGQKLIDWLLADYGVDTLLAYELGLKVQQLASQKEMQFILVENELLTLEKLLSYLQISI